MAVATGGIKQRHQSWAIRQMIRDEINDLIPHKQVPVTGLSSKLAPAVAGELWCPGSGFTDYDLWPSDQNSIIVWKYRVNALGGGC